MIFAKIQDVQCGKCTKSFRTKKNIATTLFHFKIFPEISRSPNSEENLSRTSSRFGVFFEIFSEFLISGNILTRQMKRRTEIYM